MVFIFVEKERKILIIRRTNKCKRIVSSVSGSVADDRERYKFWMFSAHKHIETIFILCRFFILLFSLCLLFKHFMCLYSRFFSFHFFFSLACCSFRVLYLYKHYRASILHSVFSQSFILCYYIHSFCSRFRF